MNGSKRWVASVLSIAVGVQIAAAGLVATARLREPEQASSKSISRPVASSEVGLPVGAAAAETVPTRAAGKVRGDDSAKRRADEAGLDIGKVIETVSHHVAPATGALEATDKLYRARFDAKGFSLTLPSAVPTEANIFGATPSFSVATRRVNAGRSSTVAGGTWRPSSNRVERDVAPSIVERVEAREGVLEWDFVLASRLDGDLQIDALVTAPGQPTIVRDPSKSEQITPALRWSLPNSRAIRMGELIVRDATGREIYRALPRATATGIQLRVPERVLARAIYPVLVDPTVGPEYSASDPVHVADSSSQISPSVSWNGTNYFLAWEDGRGRVFATRVNTAGAVLDPSGIAISPASGARPSVAWNGTNFLVAWDSGVDVYAARVSSAGTVLDPAAITVSAASGSQNYASVAPSGTNFFVTWKDTRSDSDGDIYAARISDTGTVLDSAGILVSATLQNQEDPAVSWNGTNVLVTWVDTRSTTPNAFADIYAARVNQAGTVLDPSGIAVATSIGPQQKPSVAWSGTTFLIAWQDWRLEGNDRIYASRVSAAGVVLDPAGIAVSPADNVHVSPSVAWNGTNFLVAWETGFTPQGIQAARVSSAGAVLDSTVIIVSDAPGMQRNPSVVGTGTGALVAWEDERSAQSSPDIYAARVDASGVVADAAGILISTAANGQASPSIAWNGTNFLVAWQDFRAGANSDIYAARVTGRGAVLDGPGIAISTAANVQSSPLVASNGSEFFVVWEDRRAGTNSDIYGARVTAAGALLDPGGVGIATAANDHFSPAMAWDGTNFLVVWCEYRGGGTSFDIYARRVRGFGVPTVYDPDGIAVATAATDEFAPSVAWNGTNFLVAWQEHVTSINYDISAARVTPAGAVLEPGVIPVSTAAQRQASPVVSANGSMFLIAWADERSATNSDIYAARVSGAGALLDVNGIAVSSAENNQRAPAVTSSGANFLVAWEDARSGSNVSAAPNDVYATRIDLAGTVLDGSGFPVAASSNREDSVAVVPGVTDRLAIAYRRFAPEAPFGKERAFIRFIDEPTNDAFDDARVLTGTSTGRSNGVTVGATKQLGEPFHAGNPGGSSAWWKWTPSVSGTATIDTYGSWFDTLLGVYTGTSVEALTLVAANDQSGGTDQSLVTFVARAGTTYRIAVDGYVNATGQVSLNMSLVPDTTAPNTTITSSPADPTSATSSTFTFSSTEAGSSFECALDGDSFASCATPKTYSGLVEGTHVFQVRALDLVGNVDASPASSTWRVDTTPPETSINSGPSSLVASSTVTLTFSSSETGSTFTCALDGGPFAACTSPRTYSGLADGTHTFAVRATDAVGNADSTPATAAWTVDTVAPAATIDSGPSGTSASTGAVFTFSSNEAGGTFLCRIDAAVVEVCSPPKAYDGLAAGSHTFQVQARDAAGNTGPAAPRTWTVDLSGPPATINSGPSGTVASSTATFSFSSIEPTSTFECGLDGGAFAACFSPKTYAALSEGSHLFEVRAVDSSGNRGAAVSRAWSVDTAPPDTILNAGPSGSVSSTSATFGFSATEASVTFACSIDGGTFAACTSPSTFASLTDGAHTFAVKATDAGGNADTSPATRSWTIDTSVPTVSIDSSPAASTNQPGASLTFSSNEAVATFSCQIDAGGFGSCSSPKTYAGLSDGSHTFQVRASDAAGNTSAPTSRSWTVDTISPPVTITGGASGTTASSGASFTFSSTDSTATFECALDGGTYGFCSSPKAYAALIEGAHLFEVRAVDPAGNRGASASRTWTVDTLAPETTMTSGPADSVASADATFTFASTEGSSSFTCALDGAAYAACSSPKSYTALPNGSHTFSVRATDPAGNADATAAVRTWTIDTTTPVVAIDSGPSGTVSSTGATFTFSASEPVQFSCSLDGGAFGPCSSPKAYGGLTSGTHTFQVKGADAAGTSSATVSRAWTVTAGGATATIDSGPSGTVASATAVFAFSSPTSGVTFECAIDGGLFAACLSPKSYAALLDGSHLFEVRALDSIGVAGSAASRSWTVDTTAPETWITSTPSALSNSSSAAFGFAASEGGSTFSCSIDGAAFTACVAPKTYTALADGSHTFAVKAVDAVGNTDNTPALSSWRIDTAAPSVAIDSGPTGATNSTGATFTFSASEPGSSFTCSLDGGAVTPCASPKAYAGLADGSHNFTVRAVDAAGNVSTAATRLWTVDTVGPVVSITAGPAGTVNSTSAAFAFSSTDSAAAFECALDGGAFAACSSPKSYAGLSQGSHLFEVRAIDAAGNRGIAASRAWTVDSIGPETTIDSGPPALANSTTATFTFSSTVGGSTFECSLDTGAYAVCSSPKSLTGLAQGSHTFRVRGIDAAGRADASPARQTWTVDTVAPDTIIGVAPAATSGSTSGTFEFTATEDGSSFQCSLDGGAFIPCSSPKSYGGLTNGSHTFRVRGTDAAGNTDASPATHTWSITAPGPQVAISRPESGIYVNDQQLTHVAGTMPIVVGALTVRATAVDAIGGITSVAFLVDGVAVPAGSVSFDATTGTWRFTYTASAPGPHTIEFRATNGAGSASSTSITILALR